MNWRKGIRDVIDDIISRMELISEVVEDDGHIIVYIKNDMVNYCPYAFHIIYEVQDDLITIDSFYSIRLYSSGDKTDLYILFASSMGIILKSFFDKRILIQYEEHPVCDDEFAGAYIVFCEEEKGVAWSELDEKVGLLFEIYIMAMNLHYKMFGSYGMERKISEKRDSGDFLDKIKISEECEREDYEYVANLKEGIAKFKINKCQYNPTWIFESYEYRLIDGIDGKIIVQKGIGANTYNFISKSEWERVQQIVYKLKDEKYALVCLENMLYLLTEDTVWVIAGEYSQYWVENEKEKIKERQKLEYEFLLIDREFAWKFPINPERFESLIADLIETEPQVAKVRLMGRSNNSDGGRDVLIYKNEYKNEQRLEYLIIGQCKAYKKSVNKSDVTDIRDMLEHYHARGFWLAVSSQITSPLIDVLEKLKENYEVEWWTEREIFQKLRRNGYLVERYKDIIEVL